MKVVAIFTASEALSALLQMVLSERRGLRVRTFQTAAELSLYMQVAPVDMLICDFDSDSNESLHTIRKLRHKGLDTRPGFQTIGLAQKVEHGARALCAAVGIDELLIKPMSPRYLTDRVTTRLFNTVPPVATPSYRGVERRSRPTLRPRVEHDVTTTTASNVIPLFGRKSASKTHAEL